MSTTKTRFKAAPTPAPQPPSQLPGTRFPQHSRTCCSLHRVAQVNSKLAVMSHHSLIDQKSGSRHQTKGLLDLSNHKEVPSSLELPGTQPGESQPRGLLARQRPTAPSPPVCCFCQSHVGKQGEPREKSSRNLPRLNIPAGHPFRENMVPDNQARAP